MNWKTCSHYIIVFFFLLFEFASSTAFLSGGMFEHHDTTGRSLLQAKSSCGVNFQQQNYTILTSQCKGPNYKPEPCCKALREFACPFSDELNDMKSDCASTMFSYINMYGKYPPGLFANLCKGDQKGLACSHDEAEGKSESGRSHMTTPPSFFLSLVAAGFLFLFLKIN